MEQQLFNMFLLLVISYFSSLLFKLFKIPASMLVGPIIVVAILKISGINLIAHEYLTLFFSIILGVFFGLKFNKKTVVQLKQMLKPSLFIVVWYITITIILGFLLNNFTLLDKATAFLGVIPGGIAEVNILAASYHADMSQITSFQLTRLLTVLLIIPLLVKKVLLTEEAINNIKTDNDKKTTKNKNWLKWFIIGGVGSAVFVVINFPAGSLIGALVVVGIFNTSVTHNINPPPSILFHLAQIGMGGVIGTSFSREGLEAIGQLIIPITGITVLVIVNSLILAWVFSKIFKWDYVTSFLSIVPGGLAPMVLIAGETNADIVIVSTLQMVRLLTAILVIPVFYTLLL